MLLYQIGASPVPVPATDLVPIWSFTPPAIQQPPPEASNWNIDAFLNGEWYTPTTTATTMTTAAPKKKPVFAFWRDEDTLRYSNSSWMPTPTNIKPMDRVQIFNELHVKTWYELLCVMLITNL